MSLCLCTIVHTQAGFLSFSERPAAGRFDGLVASGESEMEGTLQSTGFILAESGE